VKHCRKCHRPG